MDDLGFYILFNSISVISDCWAGDNVRLCALEPYLQLRRFCFKKNLEPLNSSPAGCFSSLTEFPQQNRKRKGYNPTLEVPHGGSVCEELQHRFQWKYKGSSLHLEFLAVRD